MEAIKGLIEASIPAADFLAKFIGRQGLAMNDQVEVLVKQAVVAGALHGRDPARRPAGFGLEGLQVCLQASFEVSDIDAFKGLRPSGFGRFAFGVTLEESPQDLFVRNATLMKKVHY